MADTKYSKINGEEVATSKRKRVLIATAIVAVVLIVVAIVVLVVLLTKPGRGMAVASDNPVCTDIGSDILKRGGSAVDSAISVLLCLGAVQPQSNGIGGGGFMLVFSNSENGSKVINFREIAPAASTKDMFTSDTSLATVGGLAVGVPGEIRGYQAAHQRYGRLSWKELFEPSIKILRSGIKVTGHMAGAIDRVKVKLKLDENCKEMYFKDVDGELVPLQKGDNFTNPLLADTYSSIAENPDNFYEGAIADNIINATNARQGIMTKKDLKNYKVSIVDPVTFSYRGKKVITAPPPASGHVVSTVLQILDKMNLGDRNDTKGWSYILEAFRYGYATRSQTGDMEHSDKTKWLVDRINSGKWVSDIWEHYIDYKENKLLKPSDNIGDYGAVYGTYDGTHTTHISILGPDGEAVSCTSTVNTYFGSTIMTDDGIILNNEMDDFSTPGHTNSFGFPPSPENFIKPGKRPMSSSSPTIVFDSKNNVVFVTGAAGGSRIITGTLLSIINGIDWKMTLKDNIEAKRIHDQLTESTLYEEGFNKDVVQGLEDIGYNISSSDSYLSVVTSVSYLSGEAEASGDPRKEGSGKILD